MGRTKADINGLDMGISFVYLVGKKETKQETNQEKKRTAKTKEFVRVGIHLAFGTMRPKDILKSTQYAP